MNADPSKAKIPLSDEGIAMRTTGADTSRDYRVMFRPQDQRAPDVDIEIVCTPDGCICYDYREGICVPC